MICDPDVLRRASLAAMRFGEADLTVRLVVLVGAQRAECLPRTVVALTLSSAGHKDAAHSIRTTRVPRGSCMIVFTRSGVPLVEIARLWEPT
jgi:hypothetical protein